MWSAAIPKPAENLHSDDTTPHNATLRIIGSADEDSVAWSFVFGGAGFRDDTDAFGLQAEGDDLALEIVSDLLERTDGSHVTSPVCVSSPRPPRPRWRSTGRGRSATHPKGWSAAEDAVDATFLPREEWALAQGKKVVSTALRLRRSRRSRSSARSSHQRGHVRRVLNHKSGRRWRASVRLGKRSKQFGVGKETREGKRRCRQRKADRERPALAPHLCALHVISAIASKCSEGGRDYLLLKLADPLQRFDSAN